MHRFAFFNHEITGASEINLPAVSSATLYGRGIFTTIAVYNSQPFQWKHHWNRLTENAKITGVDLSKLSETEIKESLLKIIARNHIQNGRARLTFFDESANGIWKIENKDQTGLLITTADFRRVSNNLRLTVSPYQINSKSPLINVKSCNYLENLLALEEAKKRGFDEGIRFNERKEVVSAATANIFWTRGDQIFTPELGNGALDGTTRRFVLENFPAREKRAFLEDVTAADEIFLTSAGIGIVRAESLENTKFKESNIFFKIRDFFDKLNYKAN